MIWPKQIEGYEDSVKNKAVFLDRDGTINKDKGYVYKIEDFEFLPGVIDALRILQKKGFLLIIITNQSGIARGFYSETDFRNLTSYMLEPIPWRRSGGYP